MFLLNTGSTTFLASGMKKSKRWPDQTQPQLWDEVRVALATPVPMPRLNPLLCQHHYLGSLRPAGRRLCSIAPKASGRWVAVLVFSAAAKHLKPRDEWIGWSEEQRRRPLSLATNNSRFLLLPDFSVPNLGSRVLRSSWRRAPTACSPSKAISPRCGPISKRKPPLPRRNFPPEHPTSTQARTQEINQGRAESRALRTAPVSPAEAGFPLARQAARLLRQTQGRKEEEAAFIARAPVCLRPALLWRALNRKAWGSESGLHQRLDVSDNDDRCRGQRDHGI